jgi:hypothetical protein
MASWAALSGVATALVVILLAACSAACAVGASKVTAGTMAPRARETATAMLRTRVIWFPDLLQRARINHIHFHIL